MACHAHTISHDRESKDNYDKVKFFSRRGFEWCQRMQNALGNELFFRRSRFRLSISGRCFPYWREVRKSVPCLTISVIYILCRYFLYWKQIIQWSLSLREFYFVYMNPHEFPFYSCIFHPISLSRCKGRRRRCSQSSKSNET